MLVNLKIIYIDGTRVDLDFFYLFLSNIFLYLISWKLNIIIFPLLKKIFLFVY
jgi:hypothetical protein